jgi:TrfA protein
MGGNMDVTLAGLDQITNPELRAALESFGRTMAAGAEKERKQPPLKGQLQKVAGAEQAQGQLILFPEWADTRRAAASAVFRSALFPALARGQRRQFKNQKIFSTRGVEIFFTGEQFDQSDLNVYLEILHILKDQPSGTNCTFTAYGLLKAIGRSTGYTDYQWLHSVLIRLTACAVDMTDHKTRYFGSLLDGGIKDEITKHYTISVNPKFAALFKRSWSSLDHEQRKQLRSNPTAQALHAYYSGHAAPGAHEFGTLAGIIGLVNSNQRDAKARIIKAHQLMKETGFLKGYDITGNTIRAQVNHTPSQNRHIAGKIIKTRKKRLSKSTG